MYKYIYNKYIYKNNLYHVFILMLHISIYIYMCVHTYKIFKVYK